MRALDHVVGWRVLSFAVSPGTRPGGAWVPGGPRPGFRCWFCFHDPDIALLIMRQDVSHVSLAKWASPQFENHVQIFHYSSTDDELTGPGYINQLACEQKKSWTQVTASRRAPLPLVAAMRGAANKLPLWTCEDGCDFSAGAVV